MATIQLLYLFYISNYNDSSNQSISHSIIFRIREQQLFNDLKTMRWKSSHFIDYIMFSTNHFCIHKYRYDVIGQNRYIFIYYNDYLLFKVFVWWYWILLKFSNYAVVKSPYESTSSVLSYSSLIFCLILMHRHESFLQ